MFMVPPAALRVAFPAALFGFLVVLLFPSDVPALYGPEGFAWASWCYAFSVPVLVVQIARGRIPQVRVLWPVLIYFACIAATALFAVDRANTADEFAKLLGIVLAALAMACVVRSERRLGALLFVWLAALVSVLQVIAFANHLEYGLAERITYYVLPAGWGGYPQLGPLVCLQFVVFLAVLITATGWAARASALVLLALTVGEAAFLYARLAWVAMAVWLLALPLLVGLRRRTLVPLGAAALTLALVAAGAWASSATLRQLGGGVLTGQFGGAGVVEGVTLNVADFSMRRQLWERTGQMIRDHWATGVGLGNFRQVYEPNYNPDPNNDGRRGVHAHNAFLQQTAELGVVGGAAFAVLWASALAWGVVGVRRSTTVATVAIVGFLIVLLVQNVGDYLMWPLDGPSGRIATVTWMVMVLAMAMATKKSRWPQAA